MTKFQRAPITRLHSRTCSSSGAARFIPTFFFEALAYLFAVCAYLLLRRRFGDPIDTPLRWVITAVAVVGALVGAKLLYWVENPWLSWQRRGDVAYFVGGKTIVGALGFGLLAVELSKRYLGLRRSTGDLFAIPIAFGIAIGRLGCFLSGLEDNTYGTPTALRWGVDFGDGTRRHPTQLYEAVFLLARSFLCSTRFSGESLKPGGKLLREMRPACGRATSSEFSWSPTPAFAYWWIS
jgi:prolipoprotein diacylglyceryltransferase